MVTYVEPFEVYPVMHVDAMGDKKEQETILVRLGRLWQSGTLLKHENGAQVVQVCEGVLFEAYGNVLYITTGKPFREVEITVSVVDEALFDFYLASKPYAKKDIAGEMADFIEDYLI